MHPHQKKSQYTLAELINGLEEVTVKGDLQCVITGVGTLKQAKPGQIAFLMNPLYKKYLADTKASAVIVSISEADDCRVNTVISRDPYYTYAKIAAHFADKPIFNAGMHETAVIGKNCDIDASVCIGPYCVIGDNVKLARNVIIGPGSVIGERVTIDEDTVIDAKVIIYYDVRIGKRVQIFSGTVIGSDGFGLAKHKGQWQKVPQLGSVVIHDDVEIGSNCSIDRGAIEDTVLERSVKLDNLVQIGHNVRIGENTAIAGCVGIAGSATIGKNCLIGGASGLNGHISLTDNVMITGMTAVTKSIKEPGVYSSGVGGLVTNLEWRKSSARLHRLDQLNQRVKVLESLLEELIERKES
jgi:UDP-3-O-[3-hydroxymyristoyl] glucosamine N-acyltransferase